MWLSFLLGQLLMTAFSTTMISANNLDLKASAGNVEIDTSITSASVEALALDIDESDSIVLDEVSATELNLAAGGSVTDSDVAEDIDSLSSVLVSGSTKITSGDDIILNDADNVFGEIDLSAVNKSIIQENDAVSGVVKAKSLQVKGTSGITLKEGTAISSLAGDTNGVLLQILPPYWFLILAVWQLIIILQMLILHSMELNSKVALSIVVKLILKLRVQSQ